MLRAEAFTTFSARTVAFMPDESPFRASAVLATILGKYATRFDGDIQSIPLPNDAPRDLPRILLISKDQRWTFDASLARISATWNLGAGDASPDENVTEACQEVLRELVEQQTLRVGRLALVIKRYARTEFPAQVLTERFCKADVVDSSADSAPLRNSRSFEIHNHKVYSTPTLGVNINSWVRCRTETVPHDDSPAVTVEQDLNTLSEELNTRTYSTDAITAFYDMAVKEADDILRKYFP